MQPPIFDHDLRFNPISEPLHRQAFIAKFPIEAFGRTVLPGLSGIDQHRLNVLINDPFQQCQADEFRAIVAAQIAWRAAYAD